MKKIQKGKFSLSQAILHFIILILLFLTIYPLFIAVFISLKDIMQYKSSAWIPTFPLWTSNYVSAWKQVSTYVFNTIFVSAAGTSGMIVISSVSAYVFARLKFPGKEQIFFGIIALMMVPSVLTLIPSYMLYNSMGMLNKYWVLIIPTVFGGSVGGVFLLRSFFSGIPEDIFESARLDGCTELQACVTIAVPLSKPVIGMLAIQTVISIWNDLIWPMTTITDDKLLTISAGLFMRFTKQFNTNVPVQFAGFMVASFPLILIFIFANKFYVEGLTTAGLKL